MAGAVEADGAGVGQSGDEMVGRVLAVEPALRAVDDQGRMADPVEQGAHVLPDQRGPERGDGGGIVAGELAGSPSRRARARSLLDRLGEDRLAGGEREALEIVADRGAARLAGLGRQAEVPFRRR